MTSNLAELPVLQGAQEPRVSWVPPCVSSAGEEAVELAAMAGLHLDPWEAFVLSSSLGERADGKWAAFEVGLEVPRQNGKGAILEARELAGLFLLGERFITHSAHQFDTSLEAFRRLLALVEDTPDFSKRVKRVSRSHGEEGIELTTGQRIRFRTRTKGGGRGFSGDCLILDEAMELPESAHGALLPTLSARPNPQVWYTGSAVDQTIHDHGVVFARVRERGRRGNEPRLAYFSYSADGEDPNRVKDPTDTDLWAQANPGLGIRISSEHIEGEQRAMAPRTFAVERLGIGDWPSTDDSGWQVLREDKWGLCGDPKSSALDPICFAFDVAPDRSMAAVGAAGFRADELGHVEVVDFKRGTGWVVDRLVELYERHHPAALVCDAGGPAASLLAELENREIPVQPVSAREYAQACGQMFDAVEQSTVRHMADADLTAAAKGAVKRPLGDAWAWARKTSAVDISPLVAVSLAMWANVANQSGALIPIEVI